MLTKLLQEQALETKTIDGIFEATFAFLCFACTSHISDSTMSVTSLLQSPACFYGRRRQ